MKRVLLVVALASCSGSAKKSEAPAPAATKPEAHNDAKSEEVVAQKTQTPPEPVSTEELETGAKSSAGPASGGKETQAQIAAKSNEEGVALMNSAKYSDAAAKFRNAIARVPEAKYFFNLCTALLMEGKLAESLRACRAVGKASPDAKLQTKTEKMIARIHAEADKQGVKLE